MEMGWGHVTGILGKVMSGPVLCSVPRKRIVVRPWHCLVRLHPLRSVLTGCLLLTLLPPCANAGTAFQFGACKDSQVAQVSRALSGGWTEGAPGCAESPMLPSQGITVVPRRTVHTPPTAQSFSTPVHSRSTPCQDTNALSGKAYTGAATFCFIEAIEKYGTQQTYGQILSHMMATLRATTKTNGIQLGSTGTLIASFLLGSNVAAAISAGGGQTPVLSCDKPVDLYNTRLNL